MPTVRAQVAFRHESGLPEDVSVNVWHFSALLADVTTLTALATALDNFYTADDTAGNAIVEYFAPELAEVADVKYYSLADPEPRAPIFESTIEFAENTSGSLPGEVALCMSFQGAQVSGAPQARRRGRLYLGPLGSDAMAAQDAAAFGDPRRPAAAFVNAIVEAGTDMIGASAAANAPWCVYSRANDAVAVVTDGWVDNAFDTQRRRGVRPTARTTFEA